MKAFFKAIRDRDLEKVRGYLIKSPELVNSTAKQPPKKDDGQSPLQVAFKTDNLEIARLLIENNADINFIESSDINSLNTPVFHDFIKALVHNTNESEIDFQSYIEMFKYLINKGVDFTKKDSYENNSLDRLIMDTDNLYQFDHKLNWDSKSGKYIESKKGKNINTEKRLISIYEIFIQQFLKDSEIDIDVNEYSRDTGIYDEFKIDTFSIEILNRLLIEKTGKGLRNFENKK
ncbi:ankyrin repeat domain-containing protein [Algibacter sp. L4_22]|uniref:ankyrin repeat domain-containing protein n=1 Tax=Algibacter sp. L4_22 TaxID=2942477 RepID=UPI00201B941E|nr:ankyrin repeat domain-containing protein [Algibacter sp. L4_22]MCL5130540.1 ankyrin repeat domain-containing protein [Algibacter sp. L4_22]